jgi:hypothetical protein
MRTPAHLSDIHFGRADPAIIEPLLGLITGLDPNIVAVFGDLTRRAHDEQFKEARAFPRFSCDSRKSVVQGNNFRFDKKDALESIKTCPNQSTLEKCFYLASSPSRVGFVSRLGRRGGRVISLCVAG